MNKKQEPSKIGKRLRAQRRILRLTLREVATAVGCSESLISKIEADRASPSLSTLHKIVAALGTNMAYLFDEDAGMTVLHAGDRPLIDLDGRQVRLEQLVPDAPDRLLQANIHNIDVGGSSQGRISHEGEEMGYVLQGCLELTIDNKAFQLVAGDSFVFRSEMEHNYRNTGEETARVLWVNTPVTF